MSNEKIQLPSKTNKLDLIVERAVLDKMATATSHVGNDYEVGGLLFGRLDLQGGAVFVDRIEFPKQEGSGGEVDFSNEDAARLQYQPMEEWSKNHGGSMDGFNEAAATGEVSVCIGWWHVHPKSIGTTPSVTDWTYTYSLAQPGLVSGSWCVMWITKPDVRDHDKAYCSLVSYVGDRFIEVDLVPYEVYDCDPAYLDEIKAAWSRQTTIVTPVKGWKPQNPSTYWGYTSERYGWGDSSSIVVSKSTSDEVEDAFDLPWAAPNTDKVQGRVLQHWMTGQVLASVYSDREVFNSFMKEIARLAYTTPSTVEQLYDEWADLYDVPEGMTDEHVQWTINALHSMTRSEFSERRVRDIGRTK